MWRKEQRNIGINVLRTVTHRVMSSSFRQQTLPGRTSMATTAVGLSSIMIRPASTLQLVASRPAPPSPSIRSQESSPRHTSHCNPHNPHFSYSRHFHKALSSSYFPPSLLRVRISFQPAISENHQGQDFRRMPLNRATLETG